MITIKKAEKRDLPAIRDLQYLAYQSEARLCNNPNIPPLTQTLADMEQEFDKGIFLKAVGDNDEIAGSVRAYFQNNTLYIGKLIVHPEVQGQGIGTQLLKEIEKICPHDRCELFTSTQSKRNIQLYEKLGYRPFKKQEMGNGLIFIYLEKPSRTI